MTEFGAAASSSSSSISTWPYHVFLSFRGEDTRYGFTGNLYHALCGRGIRTFIDDEGISKGEEITPTLLKKIKESKTAIVVFSKGYASSTFCLTELAHILDCMKGHNGRFIWPVFYDVDPSDIRHQKGSYKEAFDQYEGVKDETMVTRWRLALTEAANMSGWPFDPRSELYEYKIIEEIIQGVSKKIGISLLYVPPFPVGLECRVEEVCSLLNKEPHCDGATILRICGTGGIGKTTIARATYNQIAICFADKCFLDNIKGRSICEVQESLLSEILGEKDIKLKDYENGISVITDRLRGKKVFLVLDNISTPEQLSALAVESNWFGSGSKIIVTTRDESLLPNHGKYEVPELSDREARQLLILNAFQNGEEDPEYKEVINGAVKYGFGLPLALKTFGSAFGFTHGRRRTVKEMESFLDIQRKSLNTVQDSYMVSYDELSKLEKEIFLDIACFYRGTSLRHATEILSATHGIDLLYCINNLIDKSLVKLDHHDERRHLNMHSMSHDERVYLNMHDLIQDMGQKIVIGEPPLDVGARSRLWSCEDIRHVLNKNTGTATIQAMTYWFNFAYEKLEWNGDAIEKMKNLRVLSFSSVLEFSQDPKCLPNSLRVMEWDNYPSLTLPDDSCPINLVILRLRDSHLKTLGNACKNFNNLRQLNLSFSKDLQELPDMSEVENLEVLEVSCCSKLTKIDDSVGRLKKLRVLNAQRCISLDTFIVKGMELVSLEVLNLSYCFKLHTFPKILVPMKKIKTFDMSHTAIRILPESIGKLDALERLSNCYDFDQPDLKTLYLFGCIQLQEIRKIPPNIKVFSVKNIQSLTTISIRALLKQNFFNLLKLNLQGCENLEELPDISKAMNLEELDISYCKKLTKIDDSVGRLGKLKVLDATGCYRLDTFIVGGIKMVSIEILDLFMCSSLHTFPEILENIKRIKTLNLCHTAIKTLPESIEKLITLEELKLHSCKELRKLPNLACHNLKMLILDGCKELEEIKGIPPNIEVFSARNCTSLTFCSTRLLLTQELQETRKTEFIMPGNEIGKWLHKHSTGGSVSFWVRREFPQIALCAVVTGGPTSFGFVMPINGVTGYVVRREDIKIEKDHIFLFDLRHFGKTVARQLLAKEWNHVEFSLEGGDTESRLKYIGVYVYDYDSCMEDILKREYKWRQCMRLAIQI